MSLLTRMRKQTAVYWAPSTPNAYGQPTWGTPSEVTVRWEDVAEEFRDTEGEVAISRAKVFLGQDVVVNGVLLLSSLTSSVDQDDPKANAGAFEIRRFQKIPNLKNTEYLRVAYL